MIKKLQELDSLNNIYFNDDFIKLPLLINNLNLKNNKICIVSETHVASLYMDAIMLSLSKSCDKIINFIFNEGEENKNLDTVKNLYEFLIHNKFDRNDILIALGGGVVGDLTGFSAATYLRGIRFVQIPTSLLAQVDSSIGGKTGVDFDSYKNMIGAFHMPSYVYMNFKVLETLDSRQFYSGMAEIIKHGLIKDREYYNWLKTNIKNISNLEPDYISTMIKRSCQIKSQVVENDPTEQGERALLNYGHTLGHAIEKYMNFTWLHGECVSIGSILASIISKNKGNISNESLIDIYNFFKNMNIPKLPNNIDIKQIIQYTRNDKKMSSGTIKFILLNKIGEAYIDLSVSDQDMIDAINELYAMYNNEN